MLGGPRWCCPAAQETVGQVWDKKQGVGEYQGVTIGITSIIGITVIVITNPATVLSTLQIKTHFIFLTTF